MQNKSYSVADWSIMINVCLVTFIVFLLLKGCNDKPQPVTIDTHVEDSLKIVSSTIIFGLNHEIAVLEQQKAKVRDRWHTVKDTILVTSPLFQFDITKTLCSISNDSLPFKEINICLVEGKINTEQLIIANEQLSLKDSVIYHKDIIIAANQVIIGKELAAIDTLNNENFKLTNDLEKQTRRKKFWKNLSFGLGAGLGLAIVF